MLFRSVSFVIWRHASAPLFFSSTTIYLSFASCLSLSNIPFADMNEPKDFEFSFFLSLSFRKFSISLETKQKEFLLSFVLFLSNAWNLYYSNRTGRKFDRRKGERKRVEEVEELPGGEKRSLLVLEICLRRTRNRCLRNLSRTKWPATRANQCLFSRNERGEIRAAIDLHRSRRCAKFEFERVIQSEDECSRKEWR